MCPPCFLSLPAPLSPPQTKPRQLRPDECRPHLQAIDPGAARQPVSLSPRIAVVPGGAGVSTAPPSIVYDDRRPHSAACVSNNAKDCPPPRGGRGHTPTPFLSRNVAGTCCLNTEGAPGNRNRAYSGRLPGLRPGTGLPSFAGRAKGPVGSDRAPPGRISTVRRASLAPPDWPQAAHIFTGDPRHGRHSRGLTATGPPSTHGAHITYGATRRQCPRRATRAKVQATAASPNSAQVDSAGPRPFSLSVQAARRCPGLRRGQRDVRCPAQARVALRPWRGRLRE